MFSCFRHYANTEIRSAVEGFTALHLASMRGHSFTVSILLRHGSDVMARDKRGRTACHCAVDTSLSAEVSVSDQDRIDTINILSQYGVDMIEYTSDSHESAKDLAISNNLHKPVIMAVENAMSHFSRSQPKWCYSNGTSRNELTDFWFPI